MWRMEKPDILRYWQSLRGDAPIQAVPIPAGKRGSTFGDDGLRITGSREFIGSVIARLKDFMAYETPTTKLNLVYRQTPYRGTQTPDHSNNFVFYAQVKERTKKPAPSAG